MNRERIYIKAVLVIFGMLILSRIPGFLKGEIDNILIISTVVEVIFFLWGLFILRDEILKLIHRYNSQTKKRRFHS